MPVETPTKFWVAPSRKWVVTQITALAAVGTMYVTTGSWDAEETIAVIGVVTQAAAAYFLPNESAPS